VPFERSNGDLGFLLLNHLSQSFQHIDYYGEPFFFLIRDGETLSDIKVRIQKKLLVSDEQFAKVIISTFHLIHDRFCITLLLLVYCW
jgi:hypothetical protein